MKAFCSGSSSRPPLKFPFYLHTFLQKIGLKDLFCSKSSIILNEVGMDVLGTICKSCALKYQVEGSRLNKKSQYYFHKNDDKVLCYLFDPCNIIYGK